jgi:DNA-directed RNA polymerase subunit RPC12/RpoP
MKIKFKCSKCGGTIGYVTENVLHDNPDKMVFTCAKCKAVKESDKVELVVNMSERDEE